MHRQGCVLLGSACRIRQIKNVKKSLVLEREKPSFRPVPKVSLVTGTDAIAVEIQDSTGTD